MPVSEGNAKETKVCCLVRCPSCVKLKLTRTSTQKANVILNEKAILNEIQRIGEGLVLKIVTQNVRGLDGLP